MPGRCLRDVLRVNTLVTAGNVRQPTQVRARVAERLHDSGAALFINLTNFLIVQLSATMYSEQQLATVTLIIWPFWPFHCIDDTTREVHISTF